MAKTKVKTKADLFGFTGLDKKKYELTMKEKLFCGSYLDFYGNGVDAVYEAGYDAKNVNVASAIASENLTKPKIIAYVNLLLEEYGFNDDSVEKQLLFSINQHASLQAKVKAIELYLKLKGRFPAEKHQVEGELKIVEVVNYGNKK